MGKRRFADGGGTVLSGVRVIANMASGMRISVPLACYCGDMDIETTDDIHEQLEDALGAATSPSASSDAYRVERTLKRTPAEVTELVWLRTAAGTELGPYVRKVISRESGLGCAYVELFKLQRQGSAFVSSLASLTAARAVALLK